MKTVRLRSGETETTAHVDEGGSVAIETARFTVTRVDAGRYRVSDGTGRWDVAVAGDDGDLWIFVDGMVQQVAVGTAEAAPPRRHRQWADGDLAAPMPATVVRVMVAPGDRVSLGDTLVVLEAMKMEMPVRASRDGTVADVRCQAGDLVQPGTPLLTLS
jgi:biotin carboxyl carrier protein